MTLSCILFALLAQPHHASSARPLTPRGLDNLVALTRVLGVVAQVEQDLEDETEREPEDVATAATRVGILSTHPVQRTIAGIAAGRDEYLEAALEIVQSSPAGSAADRIRKRGLETIRKLQKATKVPGISAALVLPDGAELTFTAGQADREAGRPMQPGDRLLSGSIGKTYVTAAAHHLVEAGELDLDARAIEYFYDEEWFERLPNARDITLRHLLRHQTGIPRHVFQPEFFPDCMQDPDRVWKPRELLAYVFDKKPRFAAGERWAYADTNFIVIGMIIEKVSGTSFYEYVKENLLDPHGLEDTVPSDSRRIPGLTQGYIDSGAFKDMGDRALEDGVFVVNPQFEWCGGGYANTPLDLARWARILYSGEAFDGSYLESMLDFVPVRPGSPVEYGLGVFSRKTALGALHGHDGVMIGFQATMGYLPEQEMSVAVMLNTDNGRILGKPLHSLAVELAAIAAEELAK